MAESDLTGVQDKAIAVHSFGSYLVQRGQDREILAQLSYRIRCFRIKVVPETLLLLGVAVQPNKRDQNVNVPVDFSTGK